MISKARVKEKLSTILPASGKLYFDEFFLNVLLGRRRTNNSKKNISRNRKILSPIYKGWLFWWRWVLFDRARSARSLLWLYEATSVDRKRELPHPANTSLRQKIFSFENPVLQKLQEIPWKNLATDRNRDDQSSNEKNYNSIVWATDI